MNHMKFVEGPISPEEVRSLGISDLLKSIPQQEPSNAGPDADDFILDLEEIEFDDLGDMFPDPNESSRRRYKIKDL